MNVSLVSKGLALVAALVLAAPALAQNTNPDAGGKIRGDRYWPAKATSRHITSARAYAQEFQAYVKATPQPEPSVVKDIKLELGRYLEESTKHLATMKKDLAGDKEAVAAVEGLEKELAAAIKHNTDMIACCEKEKFDTVGAMACCTDLVKQLDKIHAEHVALMKKLAAKYAASGAKP
jgi:flagellar motility protein MotE (MotC chaperone)